jgi:hypothetical protein
MKRKMITSTVIIIALVLGSLGQTVAAYGPFGPIKPLVTIKGGVPGVCSYTQINYYFFIECFQSTYYDPKGFIGGSSVVTKFSLNVLSDRQLINKYRGQIDHLEVLNDRFRVDFVWLKYYLNKTSISYEEIVHLKDDPDNIGFMASEVHADYADILRKVRYINTMFQTDGFK